MKLNRLELDFFRNYAHVEATFHPRVNLIYGDNAQGKTNLLEAIAYLSSARSHRARYDRELIMLDQPQGYIKGEVDSRERTFILEAKLCRGKTRQLWSNGLRLKTAGELAGILTTVLFCPEDLYLIREGAAARRRFLDGAICQLRPRYAQALAEYNRLYEHKTRILREQLGLRYETVSTVQDPLGSVQDIFESLMRHQESHRRAELDSRQCLSGPHKDDLVVELDGQSAKQFGSQGQTRTAALSLKLAQREIFQQETGEWPVLLLDDVLSELDGKRQSFVLNRIQGGQVFITCCEPEKLDGLERGKSFQIQGGSVLSQRLV